MKLARNHIRILKGFEKIDELSPLPKAELLASVWELTEEIYSLADTYDAQSRLQRDVVSFIRREG